MRRACGTVSTAGSCRKLPGRPDLVFPKHRAVIFVHGFFWHGHNCPMFRLPQTRAEFWRDKITKNRERDGRAVCALINEGWRVLTVWECALRGAGRLSAESVLRRCGDFVRDSDAELMTIAGEW